MITPLVTLPDRVSVPRAGFRAQCRRLAAIGPAGLCALLAAACAATGTPTPDPQLTPVRIVAVTPAATRTPTPQPTPTATPVAERMYVVKAGDTLSKIALDHDTTVDAIVEANHLPDRNVLQVGQRLVIPAE